jgi:hypothetical protein
MSSLGQLHVVPPHSNIGAIQHYEESSPHQLAYQGLAGSFDTTIEPDAYREYSWLVRSVCLWFVF